MHAGFNLHDMAVLHTLTKLGVTNKCKEAIKQTC